MSSNVAPVKNWKFTILLLVLGWGFVGLQRNATNFLGPLLAEEFNLNMAEIGWLAGAFAIAWGVGSLLAGRLADNYGIKPMLLIFGGITALLGWVSGLATSIAMLLAIRTALGLAEGGILSPIMNGTRRSSPPDFRARSVSFVFVSFIIIGMVLAPLIMGFVGENYGWQAGFYIAAAPLAVILVILYFIMEEPPIGEDAQLGQEQPSPLLKIYFTKNVLIAAILSISSFARVFILMAFGLFLIGADERFPPGSEYIIMSAFLLCDALGGITFTWFADRTGHRRKVVMIALGLALVFGTLFVLALTSTVAAIIVLLPLFAFNFCGGAVSPLAVGIIPSEAVEAKDGVTATGCANATGEILGGGALAIVAGLVANSYGLPVAMWIPVIVAAMALVLAYFMDDIRAGEHTAAEAHAHGH